MTTKNSTQTNGDSGEDKDQITIIHSPDRDSAIISVNHTDGTQTVITISPKDDEGEGKKK